MAILKCKICGGDMEVSPDKSFGTCEYCGTSMTLPKVSDDQRAALFNRGNHFRRIGEFDKALAIYENLVREDDNDAEAHWCCALCRFGIEYVEDPNTYEFLPTCHRASFESFMEDVDYLAALEHSDGITRRQYQKDAAKIADVQKGILATSQNEEPFDVFICYKETDDMTKERTKDSIDAQEIYYQLTNEGYRVFFSRITLEDKVGTEYEPYIFAALNSAKVMVAIGSKPEYFNAVWVKNEWSRFLAMMRKDRSKLLLPCYKSMDPYDLPEQLSVLQSYDMAKIGFIQDLIRGIRKIIQTDEPKVTVKETVVTRTATNVAPLLKRAFMFLEDGEWSRADDFCEQVLNQEPENAQAYLGKLMAELHVRRQEDLSNCEKPFTNSNNYQKAVRFGDDKIAETLSGYIGKINERNENERLSSIYNKAVSGMNSANTESAYKTIASMFNTITGFKDADALAEKCLERAEEVKRKVIAIVNALKEGNKKTTIEGKLAETRTRIESLTTLRDGFDALLTNGFQLQQEQEAVVSQKETLSAQISTLRSQETNLSSQRSKLGLFTGKEKKRIEGELELVVKREREISAEIPLLDRKKLELNKQIEENERQRCGFNSKEDITQELAKEIATATALGAELADRQTTSEMTYSYEEAVNAYLNELDVAEEVNRVYPEAKLVFAGQTKEDTVLFGRYIQQKNGSPEPIEWQILERVPGRILVISKYALDCQPYNTYKTDITWSDCTLRKWLNGKFLSTAFSSEEQTFIPRVTVNADKNPDYNTNPGISTQDQVFLLSITEAEKYFHTDEARRCSPTDYALAQGAYTDKRRSGTIYTAEGKASTVWWLRSPGNDAGDALEVCLEGDIDTYGQDVDEKVLAVRPALWIRS